MVLQETGHGGEVAVQPANPDYTGKLEANGTQETGHEGEAAVQPWDYAGKLEAKGDTRIRSRRRGPVQPENPVHTPVVGSISETETQAIVILSKWLRMITKYVDEEVVEQEGKKR